MIWLKTSHNRFPLKKSFYKKLSYNIINFAYSFIYPYPNIWKHTPYMYCNIMKYGYK